MRQLVGESCVLCRQRIGSIVEGQFCPSCGCPVHRKCMRPGPEPDAGPACDSCGAGPEDIRREEHLHAQETRGQAELVKQQRWGKVIAVCALLSLYGAVRLVIYLVNTPAPEFAGVVNAAVPLILGMVGVLSGFVMVVRNLK
jgi:hypothetical protein